MSGFEVAQFNQLMMNRVWIAICNNQMPLARLDLNAPSQLRSELAGGIDQAPALRVVPSTRRAFPFTSETTAFPGCSVAPNSTALCSKKEAAAGG